MSNRWAIGLVGVVAVVLIGATIAVSGDDPPPASSTTVAPTTTQAPSTTVTSQVVDSTTSTSTTVPAEPAIQLSPEMDVAAIVAAAPPGARFDFAPGAYRMLSFEPLDGQVFEAQPGVYLTGARILTDWVSDGEVWYVDGQTQQEWEHGECADGVPRCDHPEELFIDGVPQRHVASVSGVADGSWFFDYDADRIYIGVDPAGREIETSVTRQAFSSSADNVEIRGFNIVRYANQAQHGAIDSRDNNAADSDRGQGWIVEDNLIRQTHGVGVVVTDGSVVRNNDISYNGQLGVTAYGPDVVIDSNVIVGNNTSGFKYGWEGGGTKFKETTGLVVSNNTVTNNFGPGLWTDIDNVDTLIEGNEVRDNAYIGIFHEISYAAVIRDNIVTGNGFDYTVDLWGAGITVAASSDVEVTGNVLAGNAGGIVGIQQNRSDAPSSFGPVEINNLYVHGNEVDLIDGFVGLRQEIGDDSYYTSRNNVFENNRVTVSGDGAFYWNNQRLNATQWAALGLS